MLLKDILLEAIHIDPIDVDKIYNALVKWQQYLQTQDISQRYMTTEEYKQYIKPLQNSLQIVVRNIIKPYFKPYEELQHLKIRDKPVSAHKISIDIWGYGAEAEYAERGSVAGKWIAQWDKDNTKLYNGLNLKVTENDIANVSKGFSNTIDRLVSTITHEITHLIQSLKSQHQLNAGKTYTPKTGSDTERYLGDNVEIDAFAQSTATHILLSGKRSNNVLGAISSALKMIRVGIGHIFGIDVIKDSGQYMQYQREFKIFTNHINDKPLKYKQIVWRRYNKKLVEKLLKYQEQFTK